MNLLRIPLSLLLLLVAIGGAGVFVLTRRS